MPPQLKTWSDLLNSRGYARSLRAGIRYLFGKRGRRLVQGLRVFYRIRIMLILHTGQPIRRLARNREVRLWVDGKESFHRLEKLLGRARFTVNVQMFIWRNDELGRHIASLLVRAADRGVHVDISKEATGDFFEFRGDFLGTKDSSHPVWKKFWNHHNIHVSYATHKDHTKSFLIDGEILLLTGMNISNDYRDSYHDYMIELRGSGFAEQYLLKGAADIRHDSVSLVTSGDQGRRMRPAVMDLLESARETVVIEHCYFSDAQIVTRLIELTKRGVKITIIVPQKVDWHHHANMRAIGRLMAECDPAYLSVFLYKKPSHAKAMLIDGSVAFLGSANFYKGSLDDMGEANVLIRGRFRSVWKLRESMRRSILHSRSLTSPPPFLWLSRWLSWFGL